LRVRDTRRPQARRTTGALVAGSVEADSMQTRCNVRVAALSWEKGQGRAAGRRESLAQEESWEIPQRNREECRAN
jgi:hypothetical protein